MNIEEDFYSENKNMRISINVIHWKENSISVVAWLPALRHTENAVHGAEVLHIVRDCAHDSWSSDDLLSRFFLSHLC